MIECKHINWQLKRTYVFCHKGNRSLHSQHISFCFSGFCFDLVFHLFTEHKPIQIVLKMSYGDSMIMLNHLFEFLMHLIYFTQIVSVLTCIVFLVRFRSDRIFLKLIVGSKLKNGLFAIRNNCAVFIESFNIFFDIFPCFLLRYRLFQTTWYPIHLWQSQYKPCDC